jgi:hypothetical protein
LREKGAEVTLEEVDHVTGKSCICHELGGSALRKYGIDANVPPAICPGPNVVYFRRRTNLREMVDHIYGRLSLIDENARPHMFINELAVNIDYLKRWIVPAANKGGPPAQKSFREFAQNLLAGIQYYQEKITQFAPRHPDRFLEQLKTLEGELHHVMVQEKFH